MTVLLLQAACDSQFHTLRMHVPETRQFEPGAIQAIFEERSRILVTDAEMATGLSALEALSAGKADLGLVENSTAFVPGLRAVLPVYESVLHILVRDDFKPLDGEQPLRGASFFITDRSAAGNAFIDLVARRQGLESGEYQKSATLEPGRTDIIVHFGPLNPQNSNWYQSGYRLTSLDERLNPHREFYQEGIGYTGTNMKPRVIPPLTYDLPGNESALLTVAVDTLLVARKEVPFPLIYELTRTLLEQKPRFTAVAPQLFAGINESFDPLELNFPLHSGARRYLERDEPGLLERYAETINMLVYVTFLILTGLLGLARWRAHRKKDRIDTFYIRAMEIRKRSGSEQNTALLQELDALEEEAFASLVREKLAANESFRIFTDLLARMRDDLRRDGENPGHRR